MFLFQVAYYFRSSDPKVDTHILKGKAELWIKNLFKITVKTRLSPTELEALFQVLNSFSERYYNVIREDLWLYIMDCSTNILKVIQDSGTIANCLLRPRIYELLLKLSVFRDCSELSHLCNEMLVDKMSEVRHVVLDFISCLTTNSDCSQSFSALFKEMTPSAYNHCKTMILEDYNNKDSVISIFVNIVLDMFFSPKHCFHSEDKAKLLLVLRKWKMSFKKLLEHSNLHPELDRVFFLIDLCRDSHEYVALNAVHCLSTFMSLKVSVIVILHRSYCCVL